MHYGPRKYHTMFLIQVDSLETTTAKKLLEFIENGGRIFCIESIPGKSLGWQNYEIRDKQVQGYIEKMKAFPDRFIFLKKPEKDFISWYGAVQKDYNIQPYLNIEKPNPFVFQNRYKADNGSEILYLINSHINNSHQTRITFSADITRDRYGWIWDAETGNRYRISISKENSFDVDLGPAESLIFVFDKKKTGAPWNPLPLTGANQKEIRNGWKAEFRHCHEDTVKTVEIDVLKDLKEVVELVYFAGTITYNNTIEIDDPVNVIINLGKVYGISELKINGEKCSTKWYGRRIDSIGKYLRKGANLIEIKVVTSMGNYMKSLTDNPIAQYWTNEKNKIQPLQSMGLIGPVTLYEEKMPPGHKDTKSHQDSDLHN